MSKAVACGSGRSQEVRSLLSLQELPDDVLVQILKQLPVFPHVVLLTG